MRRLIPKQRFWALLPALAVLLLAAPAWAHTGTGNLGGFAAGVAFKEFQIVASQKRRHK